MIKRILIFFKSLSAKALILLVVVTISTAWVTVTSIINNIEKTAQAAITSNTLKHKKEITRLKTKHKRDIAKTKIKERSKRWFASIPILGTILAFWSGKEEYDDYEQWHNDNPSGNPIDYAKYQAELLKEP
ncbi:MAG: hypothetical protein R8J85_02280 [Mariprofundales bacterium]